MHEDWPGLAAGLSGPLKELRGGAPEVMKGFSAVARAALEAKALDTKSKELIALAIAVAIRCAPCVTFHADAVVKLGATREEVMEALGVTIYMGGGPSVMYAAEALEAYDQYKARAEA